MGERGNKVFGDVVICLSGAHHMTEQAEKNLKIALEAERLNAICTKWMVSELALFGSVLRDDFGPGSDVDVLVTFRNDAPWDLFDLVSFRDELSELFGREVDLVEKRAITNPIRRRNILSASEVLYAA
jgi:predicted nucleotidyltransferase